MEIKTKITTTYQIEVSMKEIQYLRALTQNFHGRTTEREDKNESDIRAGIFNACNDLLSAPVSRHID